MPPQRSILVLGASGMLGRALSEVVKEFPVLRFIGVDLDVDITERRNIDNAIRKYEAQIVINCAAMTDVDGCEGNPMLASAVNADGAMNAALACRDANVLLVHVSTDFVFSGNTSSPYTESDIAEPVSVYGATKLEGERQVGLSSGKHLITRTAWTFGLGRHNFISKVIDRARAGRSIDVVSDQVGSPTYTIDLARGILALAFSGANGLYHIVNSGSCSRIELAQTALKRAGLEDVTVNAITSDSLVSASPGRQIAQRPTYSVLDTGAFTKKTGINLPHWNDALNEYVDALKTSQEGQ
jgi:dTDP-4-dehydrorhamnose reductase